MKLLIVDDEELTRTGVISSINWNSLGIDEILQADDGVHGLETARLQKPEIILCDVRMPRMDGITMLERLENELPDTVSIFMSGYSDKDYLKAAIKLKAVSYIEKPINPKEIREAILEARDLYLQKQRSHRGETLHSLETAARLALQLTVPYVSNSGLIENLAGELSLQLNSSTFFTTFIVKLHSALDLTPSSQNEIYLRLEDFLNPFHLNCIYVEKRTHYLVYLVFGASRPSVLTLRDIGSQLCSLYAAYGKYVITAGETFQGVAKAYHSYSSAVILSQNSFFYPANSLLFPSVSEGVPASPKQLPDSPEILFLEALKSRNQTKIEQLLEQLLDFCTCNHSLLPNQIKDLYFKLFLTLEEVRKQFLISGAPSEESIADAMDDCFNFLELHEALTARVHSFFRDQETIFQENPTILLIKEYIGRNYMDTALSVKDISDHIHLSASYVCTFFKNETGQTLNQYLTEYRMERAKQLLVDLRYKITEISSKVGYSDGNYFGKSFKKYSGLSPSEYREKMLL